MRKKSACGNCFSLLFLMAVICLPEIVFAQLQANFSMDKSAGCSPLKIDFSNQTTGASANAVFTWDFGNGNNSFLKNPSAIFIEEKSYTVTLTVVDGNNTATTSKTITVYKKPTVDFSALAPKVCLPNAAGLASTSTAGDGNISSYYWDFGDGTTQQGYSSQVYYSYTVEQKPTVSLTVTNSYGCQSSETKANLLEILPRLNPAFTSDKNLLCSLEETVTFANNSTGPGVLSYVWNFGDGTTSTQKNPSHQFSARGVYPVNLTVKNTDGCSATTSGSINAAYFNTNFSTQTICREANFSSSSYLYATNSFWKFGDGTSVNAVNPKHVYAAPGTYTVSLINSYGNCKDTISKTVTVQDGNFNSVLTMPDQACKNSFVYLTSNAAIMPTKVEWSFDGGPIITTNYSNTYSYQFTTNGTHTVTVTNTFGTCKETVTKTIEIIDVVNRNSNIVMPTSVCKNQYVTFNSTASSTPSSVLWKFDNGFAYSSGQQTSHIFYTAGIHTVTMTNMFGTCNETVTKTIEVKELPNPNGFIIDYGGVCGSPVTITFKDTTSDAVSWKWNLDFLNNTFSTQKNATYFFQGDGYHTVALTVTNANGCSQSVSKSFTIARPNVGIYTTYSSSPRGNYDCDSIKLKFAVNSNQPIKTYAWSDGKGQTSNLPDPRFEYNIVGDYLVTLNYTTESGCTGTVSYPVKVYGKPKANFDYSIPCGNALNLNFYDRSYFSDNWHYDFGDGTSYYTSAVASHLYRDTGKFNVRFINSIGHCSDTVYKMVYANVLPSSSSIVNYKYTCDGTRGKVVFDQRALRITGGTWNFGDGTSIPYDTSNHAVEHIYTRSGSYSVMLTGLSGACTYTHSINIIVALKQAPTLTATPTEMCANIPVGISISNLEVNTYTGNRQQNQYSTLAVLYDNGGKYQGNVDNYYSDWNYTNYTKTLYSLPVGPLKIRAVVANYYTGCTDTTNYVDLKINGPRAGFEIEKNGQCWKSVFNFTDTTKVVTTTSIVRWQWDFGDGTGYTSTSNGNTTHKYSSPGNYPVRLTVTDAGGCSSTVSGTAMAGGPKAAFTASGLYVPNVPLKTSVTFYNQTTANSNVVNYLWEYGDGNSGTSYTGSNTYNQPGIDTVLLIATDPAINCADTARTVLTVKDFNTAFAFSSNYLSANSCPPVVVRINNLSVGYTRLLWDFGDGTTTTSSAYPSHVYNKPGLYRITLYTYGYNGLSGVYKDSIEIKTPSVNISTDFTQSCSAQSVQFASNASNVQSYKWDFGDGRVQTTTASPLHPYTHAGVFYPRLITLDDKGCTASTELSKQIIIDSLSIAIKGIPAVICDSIALQFSPDVFSVASSKLNTPLNYKWDFGTGNTADTSDLRAPIFRYTKPGTYTVRFRVRSVYGCEKETTETIVVKQKAKGTITALPASCEKTLVSFSGNATQNGVQWNWDFGNGTSSSVQNPAQQLYNNANDYTISLVVSKDGCSDTSLHQLTVHPKPKINATPKQNLLCYGSSVQLTANDGASYKWTPAAGLSDATIATPLAAPQTTTAYKVEVTTDNGCVDYDSVSIQVAPSIKLAMATETAVCQGSSVTLAATGATSYRWINNTSGLNNTTIANPIATPLQPITYTVVGYDAYQCFTDTATIQVVVNNLPTVNAGADVEISGGGSYQLTASASGDVTNWAWSSQGYLSCINCPSPFASPKKDSEYFVTVRNANGCAASDTVLVKVKCALSTVHIPNSFTPNYDGKNDGFYPKGSGINNIRYFKIFNRWGELIFEKNNIDIDDRASAWNGIYKGKLVLPGTYVYLTEMECGSGEVFVLKGTVTVVQ